MAPPGARAAYCGITAVLTLAVGILMSPTVLATDTTPDGASTNVCKSDGFSISIQVDPETMQGDFICDGLTKYVWPHAKDGVVSNYFKGEDFSATVGLIGEFGQGSKLEVKNTGNVSTRTKPVAAKLTLAALPKVQRTIYFACGTTEYKAQKSADPPGGSSYSKGLRRKPVTKDNPNLMSGGGTGAHEYNHVLGDRGESMEYNEPEPPCVTLGRFGAEDDDIETELGKEEAWGEESEKDPSGIPVTKQHGSRKLPAPISGSPPVESQTPRARTVQPHVASPPQQAKEYALLQKGSHTEPKHTRDGSRSDSAKCIVAVTVPADHRALICTAEKKTMELDINDQTKNASFKCDTAISFLSPAKPSEFVFDESCGNKLALARVLPTANLVATEFGYTFSVENLPPTPITVCYKCSETLEHAERIDDRWACTVKITVWNSSSGVAAADVSWPCLSWGSLLVGFGLYSIA